ncbi:MAG: hypothetical protein H0X17_23950 [Deltaproteobacteria bacterium]|nr:hypothetical protein [Deltaproteobacteria bacterium]
MRRTLLPVLLALAACTSGGCGRIGFELVARGDAGGSEATVPATDCWSAWIDGTLAFDTPVPLTELGAGALVLDPSLADDDLTLYFSRETGNDHDVYVTTRADRTQPWQAPRTVPELNSNADDTRVSSTEDGLLAVLSTRRPATDFELWLATRSTRTEPFGPLDRAAFVNVSSLENEHDPELTLDGLRLYVAPGAVTVPQQLAVTARASREVPFGVPVTIPVPVATGEHVADPSVSPDERVLLFARYAGTKRTLQYLTRPDRDASFGAPRAVPLTGPPSVDTGGELSRDGCELIFQSERSGGGTLLHVTHVVR